MSQDDVSKRLLKALLLIKDHGPEVKHHGICIAVVHALGNESMADDITADDLLEEVMATWPKSTGSINFPVPGTNGRSYTACYVDCRRDKTNMWDPETEYGRLRLELLDHCIAHLQGGMMKHLQQSLNTSDDSFTYTVSGETEASYLVDSDGYLHDMKANRIIGKFKLGNDQWHLYIDDNLFMSGPPNGLFNLPEFEQEALTKLVNLE